MYERHRLVPATRAASKFSRRLRTSGAQSGSPPAYNGCPGGNGNRPCEVPLSENTGAPSISAIATNSATAPASVTRLPARITGCRAAANSAAAWRSASTGGRTRRSGTRGGVRSKPMHGSICRSTGSARNTGPVGGVSAVCTARRTTVGKSWTRVTS